MVTTIEDGASSIKDLFDDLEEAITPAFRDDYEPCLEKSCQVETRSCFDDATCVAKLHIMASGTAKTGDDGYDAVGGAPVMTAGQEWRFGLDSLELLFAAGSSERTLVTCMLRAKCGMASAMVVTSSTTPPDTAGSADDEEKSVLPLIVILLVVAAVILAVVLVAKKSRKQTNYIAQTNYKAHRMHPSTLTVQQYENAAYEESAFQSSSDAGTPATAALPLVVAAVPTKPYSGNGGDEFEC